MIDANMLPASDAGESEDLTQLEVLPVGGRQSSASRATARTDRLARAEQDDQQSSNQFGSSEAISNSVSTAEYLLHRGHLRCRKGRQASTFRAP